MMYSSELPACLIKQVTKMGDGTFVAVVQSHHRHVEMVDHRGRATEIGEQWLWGYGKLRTGDLMCGRFVAGKCHQLVNDDKLGLRAGDNTQMFQYSQAILVGPVVEHSAQEEDSDILLLHRLRVKEVMSLELHSSRFKCVGHVLLPKLKRIPCNRLAILDDKTEMQMMRSKRQ